MPRPRTNDPSNLPDESNPTHDPEQVAELMGEFKNRLQYLTQSYHVFKHVLSDRESLNESLERLRRALKRKRILKSKGTRLHPEIELLLSHHARQFAEAEGVAVNEDHIRAAGERVIETIKPRRGRPDNNILDYHVAGLVALIHEFSGKPVLGHRYKASVYEPGFPEGISQIIPIIMKKWDESITTTQLVNVVRKIRKKYAEKPLRFCDLFPTYGITLENHGFKPQKGISIEMKNLNIPIYCP